MTTIPGCGWMRVENSHRFLQITSQVLIVSFEVSRARIINRVSQALQLSLTMLHRPGHHQALYFILKNIKVYTCIQTDKIQQSCTIIWLSFIIIEIIDRRLDGPFGDSQLLTILYCNEFKSPDNSSQCSQSIIFIFLPIQKLSPLSTGIDNLKLITWWNNEINLIGWKYTMKLLQWGVSQFNVWSPYFS